MSEGDAKTLMASAQNVLRHYSIAATQRAVDWVTFASVAAFMYVPRVVALAQRRKDGPRREQHWSGPAQVFQFHPPQPQPQPEPPPQAAAVEPEIEPEHLH